MNKDSGYKTRQRELVLEYLKNHSGCHSADEIIRALAAEGHAVSKPTVYRTLDRFVSEGDVSRFNGSGVGESALYRFSGGHHDHFHMKCSSCNKTVCVDCGFFNNMEDHFYSHHGFTINRARTVIYGTCAECAKGK